MCTPEDETEPSGSEESRQNSDRQTEKACPQCGHTIIVTKGFAEWCEECEWGLDPLPEPDNGKKDLFELYFRRHGPAHHKWILDNAVAIWNAAQRAVFPTNWKTIASIALSVVVLIISAALVFCGIWLVANSSFYLLAVPICIGLVGVALVPLIVFVHKLGPSQVRIDLDLESLPATQRCLDEICHRLGAPRIRRISLSRDYNAKVIPNLLFPHASRLEIGYPLWAILGTDERVAILTHEVAHMAHGDGRRDALMVYSVHALRFWYELITPIPFFNWSAPLLTVVLAPIKAVGWCVGWIFRSLGYLQVAMLYVRRQMSEYFADARSAQVAGVSAASSMLDKLHLSTEFWSVAGTYTLQPEPKPSIFEYVSDYFRRLPSLAVKRLRILLARQMARIDITHPPTINRMEFVRAVGTRGGEPSILQELVGEMGSELSQYEQELGSLTEAVIRRANLL